MAANDFFIYTNALKATFDKLIDWHDDVFHITLVGSGYNPDQALDDAWSDISANEITGTGYTAGGQVVDISTAIDGLAIDIDASDESWASSTLDATWAVIVHIANGTSIQSTDIPVACVRLESGGSLSTTNGTLSITMAAGGIYTVTPATANET